MKIKQVKRDIQSEDEFIREKTEAMGCSKRVKPGEKTKDGRSKTTPVMEYDKILAEISV
jgi:hypothetical protein